jgi:hypothetical protein
MSLDDEDMPGLGSLTAIETKIVLMADKLCHCATPSLLSGMGTSNSPYKLEHSGHWGVS